MCGIILLLFIYSGFYMCMTKIIADLDLKAIVTTVSMPQGLYKKLVKEAQAKGVSISFIVREALRREVPGIEIEKEKREG